jgi:PAT family beta-lactamase induction signal transducer AmpG
MGVENLACGMGSAAFITYLSRLCHTPYTASQFALLSSLASFARVIFSSLCGWAADQLAWTSFYSIGAIACLPFAALILIRSKDFIFEYEIPMANEKAA